MEYGQGSTGIVAPTTAAVVTLPVTGSNLIVQIAIAAAVGLIVWGVINARQHKQVQ